ncbi:outer membrane lipoprotein-sorting protein [Gemmatimonadota bacterium]
MRHIMMDPVRPGAGIAGPPLKKSFGKKSTSMWSFVLLVILLAPAIAAAQPDPEEILRRIDSNMTFSSAMMTAKMTINYRSGQAREMEFVSWSEGTDRSFLEFTSPARDAGSRFLRLEGDRMWIYLPRVGKTIRIQGHMLRQGLMGSDFSYGDASENPSMVDDYTAVIEGEETIDGRPTLVLHLTANRAELAYQSLRIWIDAERWVPLKEEQYAKSGKLLKTMILGDVRRIGARWYPMRIELDNALQADTNTVMEIIDFEMDVEIPERIFTLRNLEGGG